MRNKRLGKKLVGYDIKQVDRYLNELRRAYNERIQQIRGSIEDYSAQKNKLKSQIEEQKKIYKELAKPQKLMDLVHKRAEGIINLMYVTADNELKDIEFVRSTKMDELNIKIARLARCIKNKEDQLEFLRRSWVKLYDKKNYIQKSNVSFLNDVLNSNRDRNVIMPSSFRDTIDIDVENPSIENELKLTWSIRRKKEDTGDVDSIRNRSLTGKIAGEDLLDNRGNIIIKKNSPITSEIVARAQMEGKLAELIVYMMLP